MHFISNLFYVLQIRLGLTFRYIDKITYIYDNDLGVRKHVLVFKTYPISRTNEAHILTAKSSAKPTRKSGEGNPSSLYVLV